MIKYLNNQNFEIDLSHIPDIENIEKQNLCYMVYKNHRYFWNSCEVLYKEQGKTNIDHWNELKHLDFKITSSMFDDKKSYECLQKFLTNDQDEKVLHIVNSDKEDKSLFEFDEWKIICELVNKFSSKYLTVEVLNKVFWFKSSRILTSALDETFPKNRQRNYLNDLEYEIEKCKEIWNCYRLEFFRYYNASNFFHIPLISCSVGLPKQQYKKYVDIYENETRKR
jgi:hypothetical protein